MAYVDMIYNGNGIDMMMIHTDISMVCMLMVMRQDLCGMMIIISPVNTNGTTACKSKKEKETRGRT